MLAHNIVDVRHIAGKINIADGVSRQYEGTDKVPGDGSEWMVTPDWEEVTGLVHDLYLVAEQPDLTVLKKRFAGKPLFLDVIDVIVGLASNDTTLREKKRDQHQKTHNHQSHHGLCTVQELRRYAPTLTLAADSQTSPIRITGGRLSFTTKRKRRVSYGQNISGYLLTTHLGL